MFRSLCFITVLLTGTSAFAVTPNSVVTPQRAKHGTAIFIQGTDAPGTNKTLYTAGADGAKCVAVTAVNSDTVNAHNITLYVGAFSIGNVPVAAGAGANGIILSANISLSLGLPRDSDGNSYFYLTAGELLQAAYFTALTTSTNIQLVATCADF